ncbi:hypothetical protein ACGF07_34825 [Kitasatospora sp. NPDC048194]|uniref:hypothetical protein n=1 Tax=Kitasatospora sp. NPDC048194 TaxID=3364045 RepID=UPI00371A379E
MTVESTSSAQRYATAHERLAGLKARPDLREEQPIWAPAKRLWESAQVLSKLMDASTRPNGENDGVGDDELAAALAVFEELRFQLDHLECQVIIEARRRGLDWRQIADEQGLKTPQAASQRYQRLMTRLEEIRQGVR